MNLNQIFSGKPASMQEILDSRSLRAERQKLLLGSKGQSLISFTLNIPGAIKQFPMAGAALQAGLEELRLLLGSAILEEQLSHGNTGSEALLLLDVSASAAKEKTVTIEELHPLGRLFDIDVLQADGKSISRRELCLEERKCLLCAQPAKVCARSQAHSMESLQLSVAQTLNHYFRDRFADACAVCATRALLYEVSTTPKPGLVDRANAGSHQDMDFFTFLDSSAALAPCFREFFCIGWDSAQLATSALFRQLRFSGLRAERAMFAATGGVNTHKGLIFSLGILCGALGSVQSGMASPLSLNDVLANCRALGQCAIGDFEAPAPHEITHGQSCYQTHGITGVRGSAALGFPLAITVGLPCLLHWTKQGLSLNDAAAITLVSLLAQAEDTNMIHRGGLEKSLRCRKQAQEILKVLDKKNFHALLSKLDQEYIEQNLSPGGCADLLAISLLFYFLIEQGHLFFEEDNG